MTNIAPRDEVYAKLTERFAQECSDLRAHLSRTRELLRNQRSTLIAQSSRELAPYLFGQGSLLLFRERATMDERRIAERQRTLDAVKATFPAGVDIIVHETSYELTYATAELAEACQGTERQWTQLLRTFRLLRESSLFALVARVERFASSLLRLHYELNEDALPGGDRSLSYEDLLTFTNVADARSFLYEKRIYETFRGPLPSWFEAIKAVYNIDCGYLRDLMDAMTEVAQRRNLFVHNAGIVNAVYVRNTNTKARPDDVKIGVKLPLTDEYLLKSIDLFDRTMTLLGADIWARQGADPEEVADLLQDLSYRHLKEKRYAVAEGLSRFIQGDARLPASEKLSAQINYWQCFKWTGRFEKIRAAVEELDVSALSPLFKLAKAALLGDEDEFFRWLEPSFASNEISPYDATEWPLFQEMRPNPRFQPIVAKFAERSSTTESSEAAPDGQVESAISEVAAQSTRTLLAGAKRSRSRTSKGRASGGAG